MTKKLQLSITDYYAKMSTFVDELAAAGTPLRDDEFVAYLLAGLDEEYNLVFTAIVTRADLISPQVNCMTNYSAFSSILPSKPSHLHQLCLHPMVAGTLVIAVMVAAGAVVTRHTAVFPPSLDVALVATPQDHSARCV
jgi:hypothetical protein